ncbi:hypothetical protein Mal65_45270 [Crateriforma conspicua]|nr:hypothetical protein Mal65_45270 [Crateriforma conspicua]
MHPLVACSACLICGGRNFRATAAGLTLSLHLIAPSPQFIAMLKDVIRSVDYSDCAEIALAMFVVAFAMMVFAVLRLSRKSADRFASIPLSDQVKDPRDE